MKKDSIVRKQMLLYMTTIAVCISLMGGALTLVYTNHYMNEKREELVTQGGKIAAAFSKGYRTGNLNNLSYELQVLENYMDAGILMVNRDGQVIIASPELNQEIYEKKVLNETLLEGVLEGNVVSVQTKKGQLSDMPMLVVGYPLSEGQIAGLFMCRPLPQIQASLMEMYQMSVVSLFFVSLLGLIVSYLTAKYVALPLMQMNRAAKVIANGNFEERVIVNSNDELGELAESFNHMAESLQAHEKVQKDFIANVSHDLRSPLTSMQGFLTAMLDGTVPPEKQEKYMKIVLEETQRLSRMTQSIVELSRAQSSAILLDESDFDINDLIRMNIEMLEPQLTEKNVHIHAIYAEEKTLVHGDMDKISRVLQNLLGNAAKFSPENGIIEVETTLKEKKKVLISVKDEGPGINAEDQKYVFDRFYKTDTTRNKDKTGSGIGLAIVREFLQAHGETIAVKSEEGKGATFAFSLKLAEED
ncbi:MAG: HAMP domain-containing histidine kinase [Bacteroidales bacterium]|nr:HAMP domain-containing sensor histidine kinase [Anaerotignum sp.]MCI5679576.1 HAMP domain-containing histidine kinase [Bacteroidales bacterium]MDY3926514.1 HAMP domain-containing sensor histidine kinase [Anaerotignum sp.]